MKTTVPRTGQRPLSFDGESIASASSQTHAGKTRNRWHEIQVWQTTTGKYVCSVQYHTQWEGESSYDDALAFDNKEQIATLLEEYIFPNIASIGYPVSPAYEGRQARMLAELEEAFKHAASEVLDTLGCSEEV
jgi:hypothetical protein